MNINYFDLGLFKVPYEMEMMLNDVMPSFTDVKLNVYGIEAHPTYVKNIREMYSDRDNVIIENFAISNKKGKERLYLQAGQFEGGLGNSIFKTKHNVNENTFHDVESNTFSNYLKEKNIDLTDSVCNILKVNIEGAELYLWEDFVKNDLIKHFQIICGHPSHDIHKVSELKEQEVYYSELLNELNIDKYLYFCHTNKERSINDMKQKILEILK
jgi:FkbM family methyltransferase